MIEVVRKGNLQIKWEICKSSGRIASHTPLRQLANFAPTTEPKNN